MPPSEKRTKARPVALAIDLPSEVLPTPAGPTRHRIGPVSLLARCWTARYSTMRSLTFLDTVMVVVEDLLGVDEIVIDLRLLIPRDRQQPIEVVAHDGAFRGHRRYLPELLELVGRLLAGLLRELGLLDRVLDLGELVAAFLAAHLFLDRLHLLVEKILALGLLHLPLDAGADALLVAHAILGGLHHW